MIKKNIIAKVMKKLATVEYGVQTENSKREVDVYLASSKSVGGDLLELAEEWSMDSQDTSLEREMSRQSKKVEYNVRENSFSEKEGKLYYIDSKSKEYEILNKKIIKIK